MFCSTLLSVASSALHISELSFFLITLQEKIDPVTVGVENVGEEDGIEIKTEQHYIQQLVRTIKTEQEVSFILACFVVVCACMCVVLYFVFS